MDEVIAWREQDGISTGEAEKSQKERQKVLEELLPVGIKKDYDVFMHWDYATYEKLAALSMHNRYRKILTYIIKILYKLKS